MIALGVKRIETRSWSTKYRGRLLIHAGLRKPVASGIGHPLHDMLGSLTWMLAERWTEEAQIARGLPPDGDLCGFPLPLGAVVASCVLTDCVPIVAFGDNGLTTGPLWPHAEAHGWVRLGYEHFDWAVPTLHRPPYVGASGGWSSTDITAEMPFGDFSPGRWAWLLDDVKATSERCPRCWREAPRVVRYAKVDAGDPVAVMDRGPTEIPWQITGAEPSCASCLDAGKCDPVPMRGRQGLFRPDWAARATLS